MKVTPSIPLLFGPRNAHAGHERRVQEVRLGCHELRMSFTISPGPERTSTDAQIGLWPTPRGVFTVADAHAIKVSGCRSGFSNPIVTDWQPPIANII
jgi:hypothetical protein